MVIPYKNIALKQELGGGHYGKVFLASYNNQDVAVKQLSGLRYDVPINKQLKEFFQESVLMAELKHQHVLGLIGISLNAHNFPVIAENYRGGGSIRGYLIPV